MANKFLDSIDSIKDAMKKQKDTADCKPVEILDKDKGDAGVQDKKSLIPIQKKTLAILKNDSVQYPAPLLIYSPIDSAHYSFNYNFSDTVSFRMDESENSAHGNDFVEAEFDAFIPESERVYYTIAAASGAMTGALNFTKLSEEKLQKVEAFKEKDWQPIIVYVAELAGYKKNDYKSCAKYLVEQAICKVKKDDTLKEYMTLLADHPTMAGLVFSLIIQFSGKQISISESGTISTSKLPKYYYIGETNSERIVSAVLYWLFSLAANQARSKRSIIDNLGLSSDLLKKIKDFVNIPFIQKIPENYEMAEEQFSGWLRNTIGGANIVLDSDSEQHNLIKNLMRLALNAGEDAFPVLINECIVRSLYILIRVCDVIKEKKITSFEELRETPAELVLPQDGRVLSKMCLIASASFVGVNLSVATLKAISAKKTGDRKFLSAFLSEVNIVGIGRLAFACIADSKFWGDDIKPKFQRQPHTQKKENGTYEWVENDSSFTPLVLDAAQARILYCFENLCVVNDIKNTANVETAKAKTDWLWDWKSFIVTAAGFPSECVDQYFIEDESFLYEGIYNLSKSKENYSWFYLLTQELALFAPYFPLGNNSDAKYKKLKQGYDYIEDQFIRRQTIVSQAEVEAVLKSYKKYRDMISGKTSRAITTAVGGVAFTAITGGLALTFAPGIAALIAGEAVVGLHGAALTSASLAFVGGGSLAAGGLGMAGGTAIITGGGALIGLASTGGVSAASLLMMTSSDYWVRQSAKLLTYCKCVLCDTLHDSEALSQLAYQLSVVEQETREELKAIKEENNELDTGYVKKLKEYYRCIVKVQKELKKFSI